MFVSLSVNNFQSIRNDLFEEVKEQEAARQIIQDTEKFNEELSRQEKKLNTKRCVIIGYYIQVAALGYDP